MIFFCDNRSEECKKPDGEMGNRMRTTNFMKLPADFEGLLARKKSANGFVLVGLYGPLCWENDLVGVRVYSLQPYEKYEAFSMRKRGTEIRGREEEEEGSFSGNGKS